MKWQTYLGVYQWSVEKNIVPYFRKKKILLSELTAASDINEFYAQVLKRLKPKALNTIHVNISSALKYAVEKELMPYSIMGKVKRPRDVDKFVGKFLKQSEVVELVNVINGHKLELGVILGAFYGLRRSEICGLKWNSVNFEANTITINHTIVIADVDGKRKLIASDTTKTASSLRTLPLVPMIREKLLVLKKEQEDNKKLYGSSYNKDGYVYANTVGKPVDPGCLTSELPKFLEKHGFRQIRFHDLRHSCASLLLANGVSLKHIQDWLGHSNFSTTANIYAHLDFASKQQVASAMTWINDVNMLNDEQ